MAVKPSSRWIFLRGLVRESEHWDDFPQRFAQALPGAEVRCLDLPGNGEHWRLNSPPNLREAMEFARREAWETADGPTAPQTPVYLLSISMGSMAALEWASRYPQEIAGAVLINTSLSGLNPLYRRLSWRSWPLLLRILATTDAAARERLILRLTSNRAADAALIAARVATYQRRPVRWSNVLRQLWAAARYRPPPAKPAVPLLLLNSLGDRMVAPSCTTEIAALWTVPCLTHPWAGHDLPLNHPAWVIAAVREWMAANIDRPHAA